MKADGTKRKASYLGKKFKGLDEYSESAGLRLGYDDNDSYVSYMGALLTCIVSILTAVYSYDKIMVLAHGKDVTIIMNTIESAYSTEDTFSADDSFFIAAALTAYDSNTEIIEEKKYGELVIEHQVWGDGVSVAKPVDYHYCTDEELGFEIGPKTEIYPIFSKSVAEV